MIAAFTTNAAHFHFGQRGIAMLASSLHITAALAASLRPPYPLFLITCVLSGLANGVADAAWNAWIGTMPNSNGLMGLLHGFYGLGAAFSPMVATLLVEQIGLEWFYFYYVLGIAAVLEACTTIPAFWTANATVYRRTHSDKSRNGEIQTGALKNTYRSPQNSKTNSIFGAFQYKATWIISAFVFLYAGIEMSLADWISSYFIDSRGFPSFSGNMIAFGYWSGLTLGRVVIGFLASRMHWGKKTVHMSLLMSLSLWLALRFVVEPAACAVVVAFLGFFIGPMFPEAVVMQAKVLPQRLQLGAIGFACAFGSAGGSFFPFLTGVIAQLHGIGVLFIVVSGMLGVSWLLWLGLPMPSAPPRTQ